MAALKSDSSVILRAFALKLSSVPPAGTKGLRASSSHSCHADVVTSQALSSLATMLLLTKMFLTPGWSIFLIIS